jgi:hypothetical protein
LAHPSTALGVFEDSLASVRRLADLEARYNDPPTQASAPTVQALRGGFCVLIVGSFERYLVESFEEHLGRLEGSPPPLPFSSLPSPLRVNGVFASLENAMKGPRYGIPGKRAARFAAVAEAAKRAVDENLDGAALAQTKGNPNAQRLSAMFKSLGVKTPFADTRPDFDALWAQPEASSFVEDKLDEIVNARHAVAHTAVSLKITRGDLEAWPLFLECFATALDRRLDLYASNVLAHNRRP